MPMSSLLSRAANLTNLARRPDARAAIRYQDSGLMNISFASTLRSLTVTARFGIGVLLVLLVPVTWAQAPSADSAYFAAKVFPVMEAAQCRACHSHDGVASGTRLHFPEKDAG